MTQSRKFGKHNNAFLISDLSHSPSAYLYAAFSLLWLYANKLIDNAASTPAKMHNVVSVATISPTAQYIR